MRSVEADIRFILLTGDIKGIPVSAIHRLEEVTGHPSYAGDITPCRSIKEKADQILHILQAPSLLDKLDGNHSIIIIDNDPASLVRAIKSNHSLTDTTTRELLHHTTVMNFRPDQHSDFTDPDTGIRMIATLPCPYPTHPTPDS